MKRLNNSSTLPDHIQNFLREMSRAHIQDDTPKADFWKLVRDHDEELFHIALSLRKTNPDSALDLLSDAIVRGHTYFNSFRPNSNFKAWMGRIIFTIFVNQTKKEKREFLTSEINTDQMDIEQYISPSDYHCEIPPFEVWKSKEYMITVYSDRVAHALQTLNDVEKLFLFVVVVLDLKYVDAVEFLNKFCLDITENHNKKNEKEKPIIKKPITLSAFKSKYFRIRHKLKELLEDNSEFE